MWHRLTVALAATGVLVASGESWAQSNPECSTISGGAPIIYGAGGSAQRDLVGKIAVVLQSATNKVYVVYKDDAGACSGIDALTGLGATSLTGNAFYWDSAGARKTCTLPLTGEAVDFAAMVVSPLACPLITDLAEVENIVSHVGPISTVNVLVPNISTQQSISAEAFYLVYGLGALADIAPWNNPDPGYYVRRNENAAVQIILSLATGLPVTKFSGVDAGTNANSVTLLSALDEQGIAFASGDVADANRATVRTLAWQQEAQTAGYWPDSTATAFDKANVRNGLYYLWNPGFIYGLEGATEGSWADPSVQVFAEYFGGISQPAGTTQTITQTAIANKNIPQCAMHVQRDGDLGDLYAWEAPEPCDCFFEFSATGATECTACDDSTPCGTGVCRFGYCEER